MAEHDESKFRIIEVKGSVHAQPARRPAAPMPQRSAPTRAEALEGLRSMRGAASVIERLPALAITATWGETAFWSVCETKGAAYDPFFWNADFTSEFTVGFAFDNCVVMFWGTELLAGPPSNVILTPPQDITGQIWCYLQVPAAGYYLFAAQVGANGDPPGYTATVEFCLDSFSIGQRQLVAGGPYEQYFLLELDAGLHAFIIRQRAGIFHFRTLTAWNVPVLHQ